MATGEPITPTGPSLSLDETYRREQAGLLRYVGRRLGHDAASDLVQEAFARAAGSPQAARLENPIAFLRRITKNLLIDRSRRQGKMRFLALEDGFEPSVPAMQSWNIEIKDLLRQYEKAVDSLPEKTRRVFLMHRIEELTYRQIHEELGISVATVEYHMMKALAHIAREVDASQ